MGFRGEGLVQVCVQVLRTWTKMAAPSDTELLTAVRKAKEANRELGVARIRQQLKDENVHRCTRVEGMAARKCCEVDIIGAIEGEWHAENFVSNRLTAPQLRTVLDVIDQQ